MKYYVGSYPLAQTCTFCLFTFFHKVIRPVQKRKPIHVLEVVVSHKG